jgi:hypothetical protein
MKKLVLILGILAGLALSHAVERNWDFDTDLGFYLTQGAYGKRKPGDEVGSIGLMGTFYGNAEKQLFTWLSFKGTADCAFGAVTRQYRDESGRLKWAGPDKINDRLGVESMLKLTLVPKVAEPLLLFRAESRFVPKQDNEAELKNNFRWLFAYGLSRKMLDQPDKELNLHLARTIRFHNQTVKYEHIGLWNGEPRTEWRIKRKMDTGVELAAEYKQDFSKINGKLRSQLRLYQALEKTAWAAWAIQEKHNQPLEVGWENDFSLNVWKSVVANLSFALRYDIEEVDALQWKQMLGLGIGYCFP